MQEKNNNSHPLGICQRLFNFFNNLFAPTLCKRITLGHPLPQGSTRLCLDGAVRKGVGYVGEHQPISSAKPGGVMNGQYRAPGNSTDILGSDIQVHFEQSDEGLESWTRVWKDDTIVHAEQPQLQKKEKISAIPLKDQASRGKGTSKKDIPLLKGKTESSELQGKSTQATEPNIAPSRGPKTMVSLRDGAGAEEKAKSKGKFIEKAKESEEEEKNKKKGKKIPSENLTLAIGDEGTAAKTSTPSRFRPLLMATPQNINEKSDAFIRSRKEAMSMEHS